MFKNTGPLRDSSQPIQNLRHITTLAVMSVQQEPSAGKNSTSKSEKSTSTNITKN